MAKDYYQVLGMDKNATADDIKRAYRKLAVQYHPDKNKGDKVAEERFKDISEAYAVLSDPEKRRRYDLTGGQTTFSSGDFDWTQVFRDAGIFGQGRSFRFDTSGRTGGSIFDMLFGFDQPFQEPRSRRGSDITVRVRLSLEEAHKGVKTRLRVSKAQSCPSCQGSGEAPGTQRTCPVCDGSGRQSVQQGMRRLYRTCTNCQGTGSSGDRCRTCGGIGQIDGAEAIQVAIPPGIVQGTRLRLSGQGHAGSPPGDLYVEVAFKPHPLFRVEGHDVHYTLPISIVEAALGTELDVPTLDGTAHIKIPPGTQSGTTLRLAGKGLGGDQYVLVQVQTPTKLSRKARKAFEDLAKEIPSPRS